MLILLNIACFTTSEETDLGSGLDKRENYLDSIADFDDVIEQKDEFDRQIESSLDNVLKVPSSDKNINRAVNIQVVEVSSLPNKTALTPGIDKCESATENTLGNVASSKAKNCLDSKCSSDNGALCKPDLAKSCDKVLSGGCDEVNKEFANIDMENIKGSLCNESSAPDAKNPLSNFKIEMPTYKRFQKPFVENQPIDLNKDLYQNENNQLQILPRHQNYIFKPFQTYWQSKKRKRRQHFNSRKVPSSLINAILNQKLNMKRKVNGIKSKQQKRGASFAISLGEMGQVFNDNYLKMQHYAATYIPITLDDTAYLSTEKKQHKRLEDGGNLQVLDSINPDLFNVFQNGFGSDADFFATKAGTPSTSSFEYDPKLHDINKYNFNWRDVPQSLNSFENAQDKALISVSDIESLAPIPINLNSPGTEIYKAEKNFKTASSNTPKYIPTHHEDQSTASTSVSDSTHGSTPSVTSPKTTVTTAHVLYLPTKSSTTTSTPNPLAWEDTFLNGVASSKAPNTNKKDEREKDPEDDDDYDDYVIRDNKIHMNKNGNVRQARSCGNDTEVCTNNVLSMPEIHNLIKLKLINKLLNLNTSFACYENGNKTREHFEIKQPTRITENENHIQKRDDFSKSNQCILLSVLTHLVISRELLEKLLQSKEGTISENIVYNISDNTSSTDHSYNTFSNTTEKYSTKHIEGAFSEDDTPTLKKFKELPKLAPQLLVTPPSDKMPVYLTESTTLIQKPTMSKQTTLAHAFTSSKTTVKLNISNEQEMSTSTGLVNCSFENTFSHQQKITTNPTSGTITINSSSPLITSSQQVDSSTTTAMKKVWLESVKSLGGLIGNNENNTLGAQSSNNVTNVTNIDDCNVDASTSKVDRLHRDLNVVNQIQDILNEINKDTHKLNLNIHHEVGKKRSKREINKHFANKPVNLPNTYSPGGNQLIRNFYFPKVNLKTNKLLQDPLKSHETKEERLDKLRDLDNFLNSIRLQPKLDKRKGEKNKRFLFRKRKPRKKKRKRKLWKKLYGRNSEYRHFLDQH